MDHRPTLIIVTGPTGSGKTDLSIKLARHLGCEIISADSRQLFRDIPIGTAAPTPEQLNAVKHHFVGTLSLNEYYSAARYEEDVLKLLDKLWQKKPVRTASTLFSTTAGPSGNTGPWPGATVPNQESSPDMMRPQPVSIIRRRPPLSNASFTATGLPPPRTPFS